MSIQFIKRGGGGGGFPPDWSEIGYEDTPSGVIDGFNYAKEIYDNWDSSITTMANKYASNKQLSIFPLVNTSNVTDLNQAFNGSVLATFPLVDTSNVTDFTRAFSNCLLTNFPPIDTSKATYLSSMFASCSILKNVPVFNTNSIQGSGLNQVFGGCKSLTDESLNNILQMCINATNRITGSNRTLYKLGISDTTVYPVSRIQALSNYQAFIDAGWTIGY